eukprot:gene17370-biopygen7657
MGLSYREPVTYEFQTQKCCACVRQPPSEGLPRLLAQSGSFTSEQRARKSLAKLVQQVKKKGLPKSEKRKLGHVPANPVLVCFCKEWCLSGYAYGTGGGYAYGTGGVCLWYQWGMLMVPAAGMLMDPVGYAYGTGGG